MAQLKPSGDAKVSLDDGLTSAELFSQGEGYTYKFVIYILIEIYNNYILFKINLNIQKKSNQQVLNNIYLCLLLY